MKNKIQNLKGGNKEMKNLLKVSAIISMLLLTLFVVSSVSALSEKISGKPMINTKATQLNPYLDAKSLSDKNENVAKVKIKIEPEIQYSTSGEATYELTILRIGAKNSETVTTTETTTDSTIVTTTKRTITNVETTPDSAEKVIYYLSFSSEQNVKGEFDENTLFLSPGETETIKLRVKSLQKGTNVFRVRLSTSEDASKEVSAVKGVLVFGESLKPQLIENGNELKKPYFFGNGFAIDSLETHGYLISLNLFKTQEQIMGKIRFADSTFAAEGQIQNNVIKLKLKDIKVNTGLSEVAGSFEGKISEFDEFMVLKGTLTFNENKKWDVTAFSKTEDVSFKKITPTENEITLENVKPQEIIEIQGTTTTQQRKESTVTESSESKTTGSSEPTNMVPVYIRPIEIKKATIFGIPVPFTKPKIDIEIVDGNKITKKQIKAFGDAEVGNYKISVGSLEDKNNIDITVKQIN